MNKTRKIKEIIGKTLETKNFKYIRREKGIIWTFRREVDGIRQEVYIQQHTPFDREYKLIIWTSAQGNGTKEIGNVLSEYKTQEYWSADTDEQFIEVITFFDSFLKKYGLNLIDDMLTEKADSFETTERKQYFKDNIDELAKKYDEKYHILDYGTRDEKLKRIDEVLWKNREAEDTLEKNEEVYDLWLGMAAIVVKIIMEHEGAEINYASRQVEMICSKSGLKIWPIDTIVQAWLRYHNNERELDFVWAMCR